MRNSHHAFYLMTGLTVLTSTHGRVKPPVICKTQGPTHISLFLEYSPDEHMTVYTGYRQGG